MSGSCLVCLFLAMWSSKQNLGIIRQLLEDGVLLQFPPTIWCCEIFVTQFWSLIYWVLDVTIRGKVSRSRRSFSSAKITKMVDMWRNVPSFSIYLIIPFIGFCGAAAASLLTCKCLWTVLLDTCPNNCWYLSLFKFLPTMFLSRLSFSMSIAHLDRFIDLPGLLVGYLTCWESGYFKTTVGRKWSQKITWNKGHSPSE